MTEIDELFQLDRADRCDRCGAQAFVMVGFPTGELMFCGHHYAKHAEAIESAGGVVMADERAKINVRPSVSANV